MRWLGPQSGESCALDSILMMLASLVMLFNPDVAAGVALEKKERVERIRDGFARTFHR